MMKPDLALMKPAFALAVLMLHAACDGTTQEPGTAANASKPAPDIVPAITQPEEVSEVAAPPSYEVAIASAAAEHNNAKKRCAAQPESMRAQCEQAANAAFAESRDNLDRLRGNTP